MDSNTSDTLIPYKLNGFIWSVSYYVVNSEVWNIYSFVLQLKYGIYWSYENHLVWVYGLMFKVDTCDVLYIRKLYVKSMRTISDILVHKMIAYMKTCLTACWSLAYLYPWQALWLFCSLILCYFFLRTLLCSF